MSGPFGVHMAIISGQNSSAELVVAASAFLATGFLSIDLIGANRNIREEFFYMLDIFRYRENISYYETPESLAKKVIETNCNISTKHLFWLTLDKEGEEIAKEIFKANEEVPGKRIYKTVNKLNFIGERICPPPQLQIPISDWKKVHGLHVQLSIRYDRKSGEPYSLYISKHAPLTSWEKTAVDWCEALYMSLIPWQDTIKNIQSDFS